MDAAPLSIDITIDERVPMPAGFERSEVVHVVEAVLRSEEAAGDWEVSIAFAGDEELRRLHHDFLGDDTPTDIMTFPYESPVQGGDIAISVDRAVAQCVEEGWSPFRELRFLVAHGMLHLLGWDDHTLEHRAHMLDRQREILMQFL